jgi:hypothetical protein
MMFLSLSVGAAQRNLSRHDRKPPDDMNARCSVL